MATLVRRLGWPLRLAKNCPPGVDFGVFHCFLAYFYTLLGLYNWNEFTGDLSRKTFPYTSMNARMRISLDLFNLCGLALFIGNDDIGLLQV